MSDDKQIKIGYYTVYTVIIKTKTKYRVDSGKLVYIPNLRKYVPNKNRDIQEFTTMDEAKSYIKIKMDQNKNKKNVKISKIPKSLYLILIKEESSDKLFVKVGITSKRFIVRRFSKMYGYDGYIVDTILRRIDTPDAEKLESEIKEKLNNNRSVKKYRPILESFSGYSECFDYTCLPDIMVIFDKCVNKT
jgi:hypothetical protein